MTLYELLLFLHIAAAIVWVGSGTLINVQALRYDRSGDHTALKRLAVDNDALAKVLFIPASLATLAFGVLATIEGPWSFGDLWILIGLGGIAATIATGLLVITPRGNEIAAMMDRDGMTPAVAGKIKELLTLARIDLVVLYLVIADMALKPTGDDVAVLIGMAAILAAAVAFFTSQARAARERPATQTA